MPGHLFCFLFVPPSGTKLNPRLLALSKGIPMQHFPKLYGNGIFYVALFVIMF
jgi:hypothetical protein